MELIFSTHNPNKVREIQSKLSEGFTVKSLSDIGWDKEIPETEETLEGNAILKVRALYDERNVSCFADDTGLEIDALEGRPGVRSARYASEDCDSEANMDKVLEELRETEERSARFRTCIALILDGELHTFEGEVKGRITEKRLGGKGFGYDPIFIPEGYETSFAQMTMEEKNSISHRAKAVEKLIQFLQNRG